MGLSTTLARWAARSAHVLVVAVPGQWRLRAAVETTVLCRGWTLAISPADADVLVVCGSPGPQMGQPIELVWQLLPGPRMCVEIQRQEEIAERLDEAHAGLLDDVRHRDDATSRPAVADLLGLDEDSADQMSPGGIPLAEGGEDRDGLEMDVLNIRLGPVLPYWPAGLVLRCALHGDVLAEVSADLLDERVDVGPVLPDPAQRLDHIVTLLTLAGWSDGASQARMLRDTILSRGLTMNGADTSIRDRLSSLRHKVGRSRILRWSLRGVGTLTDEDLQRTGLPASAAGDTYDRLLHMFDAVASDLPVLSFSTDGIASVVTGLDMGNARLVVASLDIHTLVTGRVEAEQTRG